MGYGSPKGRVGVRLWLQVTSPAPDSRIFWLHFLQGGRRWSWVVQITFTSLFSPDVEMNPGVFHCKDFYSDGHRQTGRSPTHLQRSHEPAGVNTPQPEPFTSCWTQDGFCVFPCSSCATERQQIVLPPHLLLLEERRGVYAPPPVYL